ncbi:hypothetical protein AB0K15_42575 [Amycolatopsis sp. NPDC049253]|uniref:hypothetical protein n=1 Tax=Amycolatopsis sp. NPDC049253 TaxID=3155274 RepID=UPI003427D332
MLGVRERSGGGASAFEKALTSRPHFQHVTFAVRDRRAGEPAYAAFARTFSR